MDDILHFKVMSNEASEEGQMVVPKGRIFHLESFDIKTAQKGYQLILDDDVIHLKSGDALMLPGCCLQLQIESSPQAVTSLSKRNDYQENFTSSITPLTNFEERDNFSDQAFFQHDFHDANRATDHFFPALNGQDSFDPLGFLSGQESMQSGHSMSTLNVINWQQELNTTQQPTLQNYFEAPQHFEKEELKVESPVFHTKQEANILRELGIEEQDEEEARVLIEYGNIKQRESVSPDQSPLDMMNDFFYENQETGLNDFGNENYFFENEFRSEK